jgi:hypothetical protein
MKLIFAFGNFLNAPINKHKSIKEQQMMIIMMMTIIIMPTARESRDLVEKKCEWLKLVATLPASRCRTAG